MNEYPYAITNRDDDQLNTELAALAIPGFAGVCGSPADVRVLFQAPPSPADLARVNATVSAHVPDPAGPIKRVRARAQALLADAQQESAQRDRAVTLAVLDENNLLRDWLTRFVAAVAASTSLADLKNRVAALPNLPQRSAAQAKMVVTNKIGAGETD